MNKFKSKKGFTLAELLIVVAIIAVLVAIAVPLFVGALQKAEDGVIDANERSLKGMAVAVILTDENNKYLYQGTTINKSWKVHGTYTTETDTLKIQTIVGSTGETTTLTEQEKSKKTSTGYDLWIVINYSDLTVGS